MAYATYGNTAVKYDDAPEEIRPAPDLQLADALAKQSQVAGIAAKSAEAFLKARDDWNYHKAQLDRITEDVHRLRSEQDS